MEQSPYWEANGHSASQQIPRLTVSYQLTVLNFSVSLCGQTSRDELILHNSAIVTGLILSRDTIQYYNASGQSP